MKHVTVIQHTQSEWLGHIEDHLEARGVRFGYVRPFAAGGRIPKPTTIGDGLILVGGGPWGTASAGYALPTLAEEISLVRACLMLDKPVLAMGLGAQILSLAADGKTEATPLTFTVGNAHRTFRGALDGYLPEAFPQIIYMRDRPIPAHYADILAVDAQGHPMAFQIGKNVFGFNGHLGLRRAMIEDLIMEFEDHPENTIVNLEALADVGADIEDALVPIMTGLVHLTQWMSS
ncbi:MAG: hypothetical protein JSR78_10510 [Proteobacteria bacterium]|nr:hypothetical protein [Pseudomonadota bacterium]